MLSFATRVSSHELVLAGLLFAACVPSARALAQHIDQLERLEIDKPLDRVIASGETQTYGIDLAAGQYVHVVVDQRGVDVTVSAFASEGKKLLEVDYVGKSLGPEPLAYIAENEGTHRLEISAPTSPGLAGGYTVVIDSLRASTPEDAERIAAQKKHIEANALEDSRDSRDRALAEYREILEVWRRLGERVNEVYTLAGIARILHEQSAFTNARETWLQALSIWRGLKDLRGQAYALGEIGAADYSVDEYESALEYWQQSQQLRHQVGDRFNEARMSNNVASASMGLGRQQNAIVAYEESLRIAEETRDSLLKAASLRSLGTVYLSVGEDQRALNLYEQSLELYRSRGKHEEGSVLLDLGRLHHALGHYGPSLDYLRRAQAIFKESANRFGEANALSAIGENLFSTGEAVKALELQSEALSRSRELGDRDGIATALRAQARIHSFRKDWPKALELFDGALHLRREIRDRRNEANILHELARAERDSGDLIKSRTHIEQALSIVEAQRGKVASPQLRASYLALIREKFDFFIDLLMTLHARQPDARLDARAFEAAERARARTLVELLAEPRALIREGIDPDLLQTERETERRLSNRLNLQLELLNRDHSTKQAMAAATEVEVASVDHQSVEARVRASSPRYAALTQPQPLTLAEIQQKVLDPDTLLLEYALGEEHSYLWAVTPHDLQTYTLPPRAEIEAAARQAYELLTARAERTRLETGAQRRSRIGRADAAYPGAARALARLLLEPVAAALGKKRLLIVGDGALHYIPFGVLPVPATSSAFAPLLVDHEVVSLPSASALAVLRRELAGRPAAPKTLAVLADPVFSREDSRVLAGLATRSIGKRGDLAPPETPEQAWDLEILRSALDVGMAGPLRMPRLPYARYEADEILNLVPPGDRLRALDFDASRKTATSPALARYRFVHFATHGFLDSKHPELSGIILSLVDRRGQPVQGFLPASEVFNLRLSADLVVLSGCQTALGKEIRGEGLIGLTRAFFYAGAARVLASLWRVDDLATAELMKHFYRSLLGPRTVSPAEALRSAQLELMLRKRWSAPFYWAGFSLQGDWR